MSETNIYTIIWKSAYAEFNSPAEIETVRAFTAADALTQWRVRWGEAPVDLQAVRPASPSEIADRSKRMHRDQMKRELEWPEETEIVA